MFRQRLRNPVSPSSCLLVCVPPNCCCIAVRARRTALCTPPFAEEGAEQWSVLVGVRPRLDRASPSISRVPPRIAFPTRLASLLDARRTAVEQIFFRTAQSLPTAVRRLQHESHTGPLKARHREHSSAAMCRRCGRGEQTVGRCEALPDEGRWENDSVEL